MLADVGRLEVTFRSEKKEFRPVSLEATFSDAAQVYLPGVSVMVGVKVVYLSHVCSCPLMW